MCNPFNQLHLDIHSADTVTFVYGTVESGYLAHFVIWRTSSIRRMSYSCLNSTLHSLSGAHYLIKRKMSGAGY